MANDARIPDGMAKRDAVHAAAGTVVDENTPLVVAEASAPAPDKVSTQRPESSASPPVLAVGDDGLLKASSDLPWSLLTPPVSGLETPTADPFAAAMYQVIFAAAKMPEGSITGTVNTNGYDAQSVLQEIDGVAAVLFSESCAGSIPDQPVIPPLLKDAAEPRAGFDTTASILFASTGTEMYPSLQEGGSIAATPTITYLSSCDVPGMREVIQTVVSAPLIRQPPAPAPDAITTLPAIRLWPGLFSLGTGLRLSAILFSLIRCIFL